MLNFRISLVFSIIIFLLINSVIPLYSYPVTSLSILQTTDIHGRLNSEKAGLTRVSTLIGQIRKEVPNTLLVDCGDAIQGTPMMSYYQGKPQIEAMNTMGYDAMVLGNHDFDFGLKSLENRLNEAGFPVLSCNIRADKFNRKIRNKIIPYVIKNIEGVKIGIIGLTTPNIDLIVPYDKLEDIELKNEIESVRYYVDLLKTEKRANIIILITHSSVSKQPSEANRVVQILETVKNIGIVFMGHSHKVIENERVENTLVIQGGQYGEYLSRVDLVIDSDNSVKIENNIVYEINNSVKPDHKIVQIDNKYRKKFNKYYNKVIGRSDDIISGKNCFKKETPLTQLTLKAILEATGADIVLQNLWDDGFKIEKGAITNSVLHEIYPYEGDLYLVKLTGTEIQEILNVSVGYMNTSMDWIALFAGGVKYQINTNGDYGDRVLDIKKNGFPLREDRKYIVAVEGYTLAGKYYKLFRNIRDVRPAGIGVRDAVRHFISLKKIVRLSDLESYLTIVNDISEVTDKVNINTSDISELKEVPELKDVARSIIMYRRINGNFQRTTDLLKVEGMDYGKFISVKDYVYCGK